MDESERMKLGRRAAYVGIGGNIFLTAFNFTVGLSSGSVALVAEAAHTLSDVLTSVITYIGFRVGQRPPDKQHPYGHGRAEALVGLVVVVFLGIVSYEIISEAYRKLFIETAPPDYTAAVMAGVGVIANIVMTMYIMRMGKRINSPAIMADAQHQKVDIFSCVAIMVGVLGSRLGLGFLDPLVAVFIAIMVLKTALMSAENKQYPWSCSIRGVPRILKSHSFCGRCAGIHVVRINYFGHTPPLMCTLRLMVMKLRDAHEIAHTVERQVIDDIDIIKIVNVHVCPYGEKSGCVDWSEA